MEKPEEPSYSGEGEDTDTTGARGARTENTVDSRRTDEPMKTRRVLSSSLACPPSRDQSLAKNKIVSRILPPRRGQIKSKIMESIVSTVGLFAENIKQRIFKTDQTSAEGPDYAKLMEEYSIKRHRDSEAQNWPGSSSLGFPAFPPPPLASDVAPPMDDVDIPSAAPATECEVVLSGNGCGEILDRLYEDMIDAGIQVFADDKQAHEFGEMGTEPPRLPNSFKIYVPVFSKSYASSERCLFELVGMVESRNASARPGIVPIFYDVEPADVMLQTELYKNAIGKHKCSYETVQLWEEALTEVARVKGWELKHKDYTKLCRLIAEGILIELEVEHMILYPFGVEDQVDKIKNVVDIVSAGMHGIGIIGKTTLAKVVYDRIHMHSSAPLMYKVDIPSVAAATECEVVLSGNGCGDILDRLYKDMEDAGIKVFADDKEAHEFGEMGTEPPRLPNSFKIYVPVFSKSYASSERCLFELVDMVESRNMSAQPEILPVFYDVEPADVMLLTELYKKAIGEHNHSYGIVHLWVKALREVARVKGWELKHKDYTKLCKLFAGGILNKLKVKHVSPCPFGLEDQVDKIKSMLDIESGGVSLVAIHGIRGIGKTTLAKEVFDQIKMHFSGSSFLADIRESSKHKDLRYLQDQLCRDILGKNVGAGRIRERFRSKRVLIILDDIDEREQMKQLAGKSSWYGSGSRILITTRNMNMLSIKQEEFDKVRVFRVPAFDQGKALQLFCMHAFGSHTPPNDSHDLSKQIVDHTGGVPLALEILGSSLNHKSQRVWEGTLEKLEEMPYHDIHDILMISYETLDDAARQMFLDIAFFFVGLDKATPVYMWEACDFFPEMQLEILVFLCLLKVRDGDKFWMHDLVRDLANEIGCQNEGRLWIHEGVLEMLKTKEGEVEARAICYDDSQQDNISSDGSKSKTGRSLRYLEQHGGLFPGEFECSLSNLKWLSWHSCQVEIEVANLCLEDLVVLDLSKSSISHKWAGWSLIEMATNLKVLNLTSCKNLIRTPDLSKYTSLEKLVLEGCEALVEIDTSIEKVQRLKYLNIKGCMSLTGLPKELCFLACLEEIAMNGNGQPFKLPVELGDLTSLSTLELANVEILEIPWQIGRLWKLESLSLSACFGLEKLSSALWGLISLELLDISELKVKELPSSIGNLKKLRVLKMDSSSIIELPISIGGLENLEQFHARHCKDLHGAVPKEIGRLNCLHFLDLSFTNISSLPSTINQLCLLQTLHLESCNELEELPELPKSLVSLRVKSQKLQKFRTLSGFENLVHLQLFHSAEKQGNRLSDFNVDGIIKLPRLETLESCIPNIINSPVESHSMSNLSRLFLSHLELDNVLPHLYNLKRLLFLDVAGCSIKDNGSISLEVGEFKALEHLSAHNCNFGNIYPLLAKTLRMLSLKACKLCDGLLDLSELRNLRVMELSNCDQVSEIHGLGVLEFLQDVVIKNCSLLQTLGDLSKLQRLELLKVSSCHSLTRVDGHNKIKSLKFLEIYDCKSLEILEDKSESMKRKHKYSI